jgi:hypothetical protein
LKDKNNSFIHLKQIEVEKGKKMEEKKQTKIQKFYKDLQESEDLSDNLQELAEFIHEFTGATGVYVGKL